MKKKVIFLLVLSFVFFSQGIIGTKAFAKETDAVQSNQSAISKKVQSELNGKDPDKEILLQPGTVAPLPDWINKLPKNHGITNNYGITPFISEPSLERQLLNMADQAYYDVPTWGVTLPGSWTFYKQYTDPSTSFTVQVYRQPYCEDVCTNKYAYAFAFRGSQEPLDYLVDASQVVGNIGGLQVQDAVNYVKNIINSDKTSIHHIFFTGHSLGGYLAAWVQSDMVDGYLPMGDSYTITFNAPGLSANFAPNLQSVKVANKMIADKTGAYDGYIQNYRINKDLVSFFGDDLGMVYAYDAIGSGGLLYYHGIDRFKELGL